MKMAHHVPIASLRLTDEVSAEYQAEVDRHTERAAMKYEVALRRLANAELRLRNARQKAVSASAHDDRKAQRAVVVAAELVEVRRGELAALEALMKAVPAASAQHRGRDSFWPIPKPGGFT